MSRAIVTPELTETLRNIRLQNKVQAKKLAEHINKSPAFISKLENGNIQTIDTEELYSILQFISNGSNSIELAEQIYSSLKIKYSAEEIEEQLWFTNYDTVECLVPIPESLIDDINSRIDALRISRQYLNSRINANEALSTEELRDDSIIVNQWYHRKHTDGNAQRIKIELLEKQMTGILDKQFEVAPYVFVFCILFYVLKIEKYNDVVHLSDEENSELMRQTTGILNSHKFFSIYEKNVLISQKQTQEEMQGVLTSFDNANYEILSDILSGFRFASERNIKLTNEQLRLFRKNMHWDLGFMLRVISLDFSSLEKTSVSNKKNLLAEIENVLKKYAELPEEENIIEEY